MIESAAKKKREAITTIISTVIVLVRVSLLVAQVIRDISPLTCLTNLAGLVLAISRNLFLTLIKTCQVVRRLIQNKYKFVYKILLFFNKNLS